MKKTLVLVLATALLVLAYTRSAVPSCQENKPAGTAAVSSAAPEADKEIRPELQLNGD